MPFLLPRALIMQEALNFSYKCIGVMIPKGSSGSRYVVTVRIQNVQSSIFYGTSKSIKFLFYCRILFHVDRHIGLYGMEFIQLYLHGWADSYEWLQLEHRFSHCHFLSEQLLFLG